MEQPDQFSENKLNGTEENPSYWESVAISAVIFAVIAFVLNTVVKYMMASGSLGFIAFGISIWIVCLIAAFGGMLAVWHYANEYNVTFKLGKGALIGLWTGIAIAILMIILTNLWQLIDAGLQQQLTEMRIERIESMNLPEEQIEAMTQQAKEGSSLVMQLVWALLMYGIPNILTGLIGVPLFAKEEDDF